MVREENQDSFRIQLPENSDQERSQGRLLVLADGMGGLAYGGQASQIAVKSICEVYYKGSDGDLAEDLVDAVKTANLRIFEESQNLPGNQPMGSTVTTMAIVEDHAVVVQVGDSRAYRITKEKGIEQITHDHTLVQELADRGEIEPDSLHYLLNRNVLTRGLGLQQDVDVDVFELKELTPGETYLLCSDGLYDVITNSEIETHVHSYGRDLEVLVQSLLDLARSRGAPDNVTIIVGRVETSEAPVSATDPMPSGATSSTVTGDRLTAHAEETPWRQVILTPLLYIVVFALGAIFALILQTPRDEGGKGSPFPAASIDRILLDEQIRDHLRSSPDAQLRQDFERVEAWRRDHKADASR